MRRSFNMIHSHTNNTKYKNEGTRSNYSYVYYKHAPLTLC